MDKLINWDIFRDLLSVFSKKDVNSNVGRKSYDKISMLKLILLDQLNSLSNEELEYSLRVRLDLLHFLSLILKTMCNMKQRFADLEINYSI